MKAFFVLPLLLLSFQSIAADSNKDQWQSTTLSEDTIKKVQEAKYKYMQCITKEVQNKNYVKMDTRAATDKVIKHCEPSLAKIRKVFIAEKVPASIADRYLKMTRTQTARKVLEQLMYADAARKMGK